MDTAKQMEMAFMMEEGGLTDDGATVDPVSGNEVPPGSLAEEVRDDIPAQLSEGEYVVPADVVRFYGVKFFEDLRNEAKRGLIEMESNGRIGGEPIEMSEGDVGDLTPEEVAALEQVTGMAMGGTVSANPYLQQQQMYSRGYNEGGAEIDPNVPQFTPQTGLSFAPGFLAQSITGTANQAANIVTLYGPNGEIITLNLADATQKAQYDSLIEQGYSLTPIETTTETTVGQTAPSDDDKPTMTADQQQRYNRLLAEGSTTFNVADIASEDLEKTAKSMSMMGRIAGGLSSVLGAPISAFVNAGMAAKYNDVLERMEAEGIETDLKRKKSIFGGESDLFANLIDRSDIQEGNKKGVDFGDTWLGDLLGFDGSAGVDGPGLRDSLAGARRDQTYTAPEPGEAEPEPVDTRTPEQRVSDATQDWIAATAAVNSTSPSDPAAWNAAMQAQAAASRAATSAIQEESGWTGFFSPPEED